jgi:PAS domain-containing protein
VILNYGITILSVAGAFNPFHRLWGIDPSVSLFLCAIVLQVGWRPRSGLLATALSILAIYYFFLQPIYSFAPKPREIPRLTLFSVAGLLVVSLSAAQRRAAASLRRAHDERQRELQLTIDSIPVMVSTFEPDGTCSFVNQQWQNYTGHTQQEATGKELNTSVYYHPDDVQQFENAWGASQAKGETLSVDVRTAAPMALIDGILCTRSTTRRERKHC